MSENRLQRLADRLETELNEFLKITTGIIDTQSRFTPGEPDFVELRALGSLLHDLYNGAERIFSLIAKEVDRQPQIGASSHRMLLDQMAAPISKVRREVIQPNTFEMLQEYLAFRHLVRNIYGFNLAWERMQPLVDNAIPAIEATTADIQRFIALLRMRATDA